MPSAIFGGRGLGRTLRGAFNPNHYLTLLGVGAFADPYDSYVRRYVLGRGEYPHLCRIRLSTRRDMLIETRSIFDMFTVMEIFARKCYPVRGDESVIVDMGANIGISAMWFLSQCRDSFVYGFEPLDKNVELFYKNLGIFVGRYQLEQKVIYNYNGEIQFNIEETGRYSGVGVGGCSERAALPCIKAGDVIERLLVKHSSIDIMKIDIEGAEGVVLGDLSLAQLRRIKAILIEGNDVPIKTLLEFGMRVRSNLSGVKYLQWVS